MSAYVIVEMTVTDPVAIEGYRKLAGESVAAAGGRFIVRGGPTEVLDGDWSPQRVVVIAFPDMASARAWRSSPGYRRACEIRDRAATTRMILVEGIA